MKNFICTFTRPEELNTNYWKNIMGKMLYDLSLLGREDIDDYSLTHYAITLARNAKPLEKRPDMSFFGFDEPGNMPSDCRVEYFYKPSYIATMFLMKAVLLDQMLLEERIPPLGSNDTTSAPMFRDVLQSCMLGCTGRGFAGAGFDDIDGLAETMLLFSGNGASVFLAKHGNLCPEFTELYNNKIEFLRAAVEKGSLKGDWGDDHTNAAQRVLENHEKSIA